MSRHRHCSLIASGVLLTLIASPTQVHAEGVIAGRLALRTARGVVEVGALERSAWGHLVVPLRRGRKVIDVRPDADGIFTSNVPDGSYRFEYVVLGERAEFFVPVDFRVQGGKLNCIGTMELTVPGGPDGLGQNAGSSLTIRDDCRELASKFGSRVEAKGDLVVSAPRPGSTQIEPRDPIQLATGLRMDLAAANGSIASIGGTFAYPFRGLLGQDGTFIGLLSVAQVRAGWLRKRFDQQNAASSWSFAAGAGYSVRFLEVAARGGYVAREGNDVAGLFGDVGVRLGGEIGGIGLRWASFESGEEGVLSFLLDLSPVAVMGSLL